MLDAVCEPTLWVLSEGKRRQPLRGAPDGGGPTLSPPSVQSSQGPGLSSASTAVAAFTRGLPGPSLSTALQSARRLASPCPAPEPLTTNIPLVQIIPNPLWPEGISSFPQCSRLCLRFQVSCVPCGCRQGAHLHLGGTAQVGSPWVPPWSPRVGSCCGVRPGVSSWAALFVCPSQAMQPPWEGQGKPARPELTCMHWVNGDYCPFLHGWKKIGLFYVVS